MGPQKTLGNQECEVIWIILYLFPVTLSGKKDSGKQRRRHKGKNELANDTENDSDSENALNEMEICGSQDSVHNNGREKVGDHSLSIHKGSPLDLANFVYTVFY